MKKRYIAPNILVEEIEDIGAVELLTLSTKTTSFNGSDPPFVTFDDVDVSEEAEDDGTDNSKYGVNDYTEGEDLW